MSADVAAIRARMAAATDGPWRAKVIGQSVVQVQPYNSLTVTEADADLIGHAPTDLAALLANLEAKDAAIARVLELVDILCDCGDERCMESAHRSAIETALDGDT